VSSTTNRRALLKCDNQVFEQSYCLYLKTLRWTDVQVRHGPLVERMSAENKVHGSNPGGGLLMYLADDFLLKCNFVAPTWGNTAPNLACVGIFCTLIEGPGQLENLCFRFGSTKYFRVRNTEANWANRKIPW